MAKQKGQLQRKMCDDNGDTFIAILNKLILAPDLCNKLYSIITLMNLGHHSLFHKGFLTVYFGAKYLNAVTLLHGAQSKHVVLREIKVM